MGRLDLVKCGLNPPVEIRTRPTAAAGSAGTVGLPEGSLLLQPPHLCVTLDGWSEIPRDNKEGHPAQALAGRFQLRFLAQAEEGAISRRGASPLRKGL